MKRCICLSACTLLLVAGTVQLAVSLSRSENRNVRRRAVARARSTTNPCGANNSNTPGCTTSGPFVPDCDPLPFPKRTGLAVDERCPNEGCGSRASDKAQNRIKNFLCATGTPVQMGFTTVDKLQKAVDTMKSRGTLHQSNGSPPPPAERALLKDLSSVDAAGHTVRIGEGTLVSVEAVVFDAKHDDTRCLGFSGEGVNCKNDTTAWNDIHIALVENASITDECQSMTAEIIPHFRPAVWDRFDSNAKTTRAVHGLPVKGLRVRLTGQLFFDGSHVPKPCQGPRRRSSWEIHPVYKIEVKDGGTFISFDDWAAKQH